MSTPAYAQHSEVSARPWSLSAMLGALMTFVVIAVVGLFVSLAVEYLGMVFQWWALPGAAHSEQLLRTELSWLQGNFIADEGYSRVAEWTQYGRETLTQWTFIDDAMAWIASDVPSSSDAIESLRTSVLLHGEYVIATSNVIQLYGARLAVTILSLPAFALAAIMGIVDGLVRRDLRRFGGGNESSFFYHHLKSVLKPLIWGPIIIYLALPFSVHPTLVFVTPAVAFGWFIANTIAQFKKYL